MAPYIMAAQIVIAIVLIAFVLAQSRGEGFNASFSSDSSIFRTRRGVEKWLFYLTIAWGILFVLISIAAVIAVRS